MKKALAAAAAAGAAVVLLVGCSGGGAGDRPDTAPAATPRISTPADEPTPAAPANDQFSKAVEFTRLVHNGDDKQAGTMVADNSPAARYVIHQLAMDKAYQIDGPTVDPEPWTIDGDADTGAIRLESQDGSQKYTWSNFTFDRAGKITAWTGASGPVKSVLWTRESSDKTPAASARLVSAYRNNAGNMDAVVEVTAKRDVRFYVSSYTADDGFRQNASNQSSQTELAKGERTLTWYTFDDAKFGGKLRLNTTDAKGYDAGDMVLRVR